MEQPQAEVKDRENLQTPADDQAAHTRGFALRVSRVC